jgi:hypothetical protein
MPRTRDPPKHRLPTPELESPRAHFRKVVNGGGNKRLRRGGGRAKGKPNHTTRLAREAIVEGLSLYGENGKGKNGMVGFVLAAIRKDIRNGVSMLGMICPKQVDAVITRTDVVYKTIAELDSDLAKRGLPGSQEIFKLEYKTTDDDDVVVVAEEVIKEGE